MKETRTGPETTAALRSDEEEQKNRSDDIALARQKIEESENLKTAFLQNISHEIRTPLNGIMGFSELLGEEGVTQDDMKKYSAFICQNGIKLIEIVNNILDISKIQTGQVYIEKKPVNINSVFSDLSASSSIFAESKNISLNFHIPENQIITIYSDETNLYQIFTKLLNNAIKFTKSGKVDVGYKISGNIVEFYISDTGVGIPPELLNRIFERFFQVKQPGVHEGSGLGLAICLGLAKLLDGNIRVESELNIGSTFYLSLPYLPINQLTGKETKISEFSKKNSPVKILVAEDDNVNFIYLRIFLENSGISVLHAENGKIAVDMVRENPDIDLILMDINMPVMDGIEAAKLIKLMRPELPIIAHTAQTSPEEEIKISFFGCDDYLAKPFKNDQLDSLINKFLN